MTRAEKTNYRRDLPAIISFLVTNQCVCRCGHCFNWRDTNPAGAIGDDAKQDLSVEEIRRIFLGLGPVDYIYIGGGEPFLRKDLYEVLKVIYGSSRPKTINISTNGQAVEETCSTTDNFLRDCSRTHLIIKVSIDGIGKDHDGIRGLPGAFDRAIATYRSLSALKRKYKNLKVGINTVFSSLNQAKIFDLYRYLSGLDPRPDCMAQLLVRDHPRDPACKAGLNLEYYKRWTRMYVRDMIMAKFEPEIRVKIGTILMYDYIYRIIDSNECHLKCYAGHSGGFIDNEGLVSACEHQKPFGSLRQNDYDMSRIWHSREADKIRDEIMNGCFCTNEPQWWHPTILYDKRVVPNSVRFIKQAVSSIFV